MKNYIFAAQTLDPTRLLGWTPLGDLYILKKLFFKSQTMKEIVNLSLVKPELKAILFNDIIKREAKTSR